MKTMFRRLVLVLCLALLAAPVLAANQSVYLPVLWKGGGPAVSPTPIAATPAPEGACPAGQQEALCTHVVDGDTVDALISGVTYRIRYIGIDTPETPNDCYASEATEYNRQLVLDKTLCLEKDVSETDRFGRLLRYVYVGDTFVNAVLVRNGYALASTFPPDVAHSAYFAALQADAQAEGAGLWSGCPTPTPEATVSPTAVPGVCLCTGDLYNCGDFSTQAAAQACFAHCLAEVGTDVHRLDSDGDGIACEGLP